MALLGGALLTGADAPRSVAPGGFTWKNAGAGVQFFIEFPHTVKPKATDEVLQSGYYYIDFYNAAGPVEQADWPMNQADIEHVRRLYYADQKVLRFIFYPKAGTHPRFAFSGGDRIYNLMVSPFRLVPLSAAKQAPAGARKKVVIIDPGHGGKSNGARTSLKVNGRHYYEKELVLEIAKRMVPFFESSPNLEYRLTRTSDAYVSLEDRIRYAEKEEGDIFVSIHLNATDSRNKNARGFEIYFLSDGSKETNRQLEDLENDRGIDVDSGISGGGSLRTILADLANSKIQERRAESRDVCHVVDALFRLDGPFKSRSRGVKSANFRVLMNYEMPSVLAECGFIDNPEDASLLVQPKYQAQIAALLFNAINLYFSKMDPEFQGYQAPLS